jgi:hypothetical protein
MGRASARVGELARLPVPTGSRDRQVPLSQLATIARHRTVDAFATKTGLLRRTLVDSPEREQLLHHDALSCLATT